jgi:acetaldehyde dehydrogenase
MPNFGDIKLVFDATSANAHRANWAKLRETGVRILDLTPASIGPFCVRWSISTNTSTRRT